MMSECENALAEALAADLGRSHMEAWFTETRYVAQDAKYMRRHLRKWAGPRHVSTPLVGFPGRSWTQARPRGVVLIIGAWNYPIQTVLSGAAAAIAAGNCVVFKSSEKAPASSALHARIVAEYLDEQCIRIMEGGAAEAACLLELPWYYIMYTGGGCVVLQAAAKYLTPVTLELGGEGPLHSFGRIVNAFRFGRLQALVSDANAHVAIGGQTNAETRYIAPTVLTSVQEDSAVMEEELFGPVLPILCFENLDSAIHLICARDKPLASYPFIKDSATERRFVERVSCGNMCINDTMYFAAVHKLPFGGVGASGMGCWSGEQGFKTFSYVKAVIKRGWWPDSDVRFAPYSQKKLALFKLIFELSS
ncbi:Aldehyde dehydrogenase family 3 member I1, chloroplastic [Porphyridium purpureum]|uniref:Aldehyde dehydrogenase family 3 member I1, chloroplastic n=1 Tax=Porphyridium purpureum TaxID=35688 RepID=A0A5J4YLZ7_PORPP|nr:Aldehyde dehydrogenase family 3 member I1, chloroplastic [Porphyridium purpureum]|eukprot:POR7879..scf291_13